MKCPVHSSSAQARESKSLHKAPLQSPKAMQAEAREFITQYYRENDKAGLQQRLKAVHEAIEQTGTYRHTANELQYGAQLAWRNSNKCIGRLFWKSLKLADGRDLQMADDIAEACFQHLQSAFNGGQIQSTITVFKAPAPGEEGITIHNHQLVQYAGFARDDGSILGDPQNVALTRRAQSLGWEPAQQTPFTVLPLIIQLPGEPPQLFEVPDHYIHRVPLHHPERPGFRDLNLEWYAVPALADMRLQVGGISYTAAPFNGWYMGTEVGSRDLGDAHRYNVLPQVARLFELDTDTPASLWKDRALAELNRAVLHSYQQAGVKMVDHHTASEQFMHHKRIEERHGRTVTGNWAWLVPPAAGSASPLFFEEMDDTFHTPNFFYQGQP